MLKYEDFYRVSEQIIDRELRNLAVKHFDKTVEDFLNITTTDVYEMKAFINMLRERIFKEKDD